MVEKKQHQEKCCNIDNAIDSILAIYIILINQTLNSLIPLISSLTSLSSIS